MSRVQEIQRRVAATGLLQPGLRVLMMLSGGADSVCLQHVCLVLLGPESVRALHVNHGLRPAAAEDERFCAALCERLGVALDVERVTVPEQGNLEAMARAARYEAAERVRERHELDRIATGHTAGDQVETVLYRLASSPGRRALLGMQARSGRLVRPLLALERDETRAYCEEAELGWREDETNLDRRFARNRLRLDVVPMLREVHPAADRNILATADQLREEASVLDRAVEGALEQVAAVGPSPAVESARLRELEPALRRLVLRRLAEAAAGGPLPLRTAQVAEIERIGSAGGSAAIDLGAGVRVVSEYGVLRFQRAADAGAPEPALLAVPGRCRFGEWDVTCDVEDDGARAAGALGSPDDARLDAAKLGQELTVRAWHEGDRMRPLGLTGSKSLQDLFTDRKVPRALRHTLPIVESGGEIAWVAGVALSDRFKVTAKTARTARLRAVRSERAPGL